MHASSGHGSARTRCFAAEKNGDFHSAMMLPDAVKIAFHAGRRRR
jgi:hypothetical protein